MQGSYDPALVVLSIVVAIAASYAALALAAQVTSSSGRRAVWWLVGGAFAMGAGIWSMHFVAMLAFKLPIRMAYDPALTAASMLIAIVTSGFALAVVGRLAIMSETEVDPPILAAGGVIMGAGICGMHYTGMAAMRMSPPIEYSPLLFGASMLIAVTASMAALWLAFTLRSGELARRQLWRVLAATVMGFAIAGMHYTGMAAANFDPNSFCAVTGFDVDNQRLAVGIAGSVLAILGVAIGVSVLNTRHGGTRAVHSRT